MDIAALDRYLDGVDHLPPSPAVLLQLIDLFLVPDRDADEIVRLARRDPVLAAKVLQKCNQLLHASNESVVDIHEAVFRLGFFEVYRITVMLFGMRVLSADSAAPGFPQEQLRRHASIAAIAAGALAQEAGESEGFAFTAGLLHDLGKVVLAMAEGVSYAVLLRECNDLGIPLYQTEQITYGFHHAALGARLLARWGVPEEVCNAVQYHHHLEESAAHYRAAAIVHLANAMAHRIQVEGPADEFSQPEAAMAALGLAPEAVSRVEGQVRRQIEALPQLVTA